MPAEPADAQASSRVPSTGTGKAKSTPPAAPRLAIEYGVATHCLALLISFCVLIFLIIAYSASAMPDADTPGGMLGSVSWLVHVNQTTSTTVPGLSVGDGMSVGRWGLGTFGWCKWTYNGADMMQKGVCTKKFAWTLPGSADKGDEILALDLPNALATAMPILAHFLLLSILLILGYTVLLLQACVRPPSSHTDGPSHQKVKYELYPASTTSPYAPGQAVRLAAHDRIRGLKWGGGLLLAAWAAVLPVVVSIGVGVYKVEREEKGLMADLGVGGALLTSTLVLIPVIYLLVYIGGLRVTHKKRKA